MKLILKNSTVLFQSKNYQEVTPVSVLNTPTSFYIRGAGSSIAAGGTGGGSAMYVNIYSVTAGTTYYIKSLPNSVRPNSNLGTTPPVSIVFGTNLLSGTGDISNSSIIGQYDIKDTTLFDFSIKFTPSQNGYIYINEYNMVGTDDKPAMCLSSVFL